MVDPDLVASKLSDLADHLERVRIRRKATAEELVQTCADIASHLIADEGWAAAASLGVAFARLRDQGVISARVCTALARAVGVRNVVAHGYASVRPEMNQEYAASMLNPPFSIIAERAGLRSLGLAVAVLGPYQATAGFVLRSWAEANGRTLERYIRAYVESFRWALAPANREETVALLACRLDLAPDLAALTYVRAVDPVGSLAPDARLDFDGFRNVLALRAELEGHRGDHPPSAELYYDPQYYERALAQLAAVT
jgi:uncharacterized protein YutE (UPF0331/DUF86 family)